MTTTARQTTARRIATYAFGDEVTFTNQWGQTAQHAVVIRQDGDTLTIDYLGCMHEITLDQLS